MTNHSRMLILAVIWALVALGGTGCDYGCRGGLQFRILFEDAKGISPGSNVVYRSIVIGSVEKVGLAERLVAVDVCIQDRASSQVCEDAEFRIVEDTTQDPESSTPMSVQIQPTEGRCALMAENATVRGRDSEIDTFVGWAERVLAPKAQEFAEHMAKAIAEISAEISRQGAEISEEIEQFPESPEAERLLELATELERETLEALEQAEDELEHRLPEIRREYEELLDQIQSPRAD